MLLDFVQDEEHSILVSSHITSDLEKIADYIVFIHEGKVVFSKPKDELLEQYGVIKCGAAQFDALDKSDIITYRKMDYEWQILVSERDKMQKKYPKALIVPEAASAKRPVLRVCVGWVLIFRVLRYVEFVRKVRAYPA